ncbi:hypothetical protein F4808DRAFT_68469 [Astrocystis sublimbata]|nr:hypothetical protein F4808DRAFT_68469 [Astrocystis sublimbata]
MDTNRPWLAFRHKHPLTIRIEHACLAIGEAKEKDNPRSAILHTRLAGKPFGSVRFVRAGIPCLAGIDGRQGFRGRGRDVPQFVASLCYPRRHRRRQSTSCLPTSIWRAILGSNSFLFLIYCPCVLFACFPEPVKIVKAGLALITRGCPSLYTAQSCTKDIATRRSLARDITNPWNSFAMAFVYLCLLPFHPRLNNRGKYSRAQSVTAVMARLLLRVIWFSVCVQMRYLNRES